MLLVFKLACYSIDVDHGVLHFHTILLSHIMNRKPHLTWQNYTGYLKIFSRQYLQKNTSNRTERDQQEQELIILKRALIILKCAFFIYINTILSARR